MKNDLLFIWITILIGSLNNIEQWFKICSYGIGILVGVTVLVRFVIDFRNGNFKIKK